MKRGGLKVRTGLRAPALPPVSVGDTVFFAGDTATRAEPQRFVRFVPVGLAGIANMAPLVVGPRCVTPETPCAVCWYCKTWEMRNR